MQNIYQSIYQTERTLSYLSAYPVLGTLSGSLKVVFGVVQSLVGMSLGIIARLFTRRDSSLTKHAWIHVSHGLGNIGIGLLEAIPVVGSILYRSRYPVSLIRLSEESQVSDEKKEISSLVLEGSQENTYFPYLNLVKQKISITWSDPEKYAEAGAKNRELKQYLKDHPHGDYKSIVFYAKKLMHQPLSPNNIPDPTYEDRLENAQTICSQVLTSE
ncbi:MAG: hypothetical protein AAGI90_01030 [Chlamydiota bacterium]